MTFAEPILHVDMDAFFVEVERLRDPTLRGVPVVVGGLGDRGVVSSASYEARRHGVRSAMPTAHARRLCSEARFLPPDHTRYRQVSRRLFALLRTVTPLVEGVSLDEAFLDVSGLRRHAESSVAVARRLRRRIRDELELPASVGVAATKLVAKLASEAAKPDGLLHVAVDGTGTFLAPLPVTALWGVGAATQAALERIGVRTIGDLAAIPVDTLEHRVGRATGRLLHELAHGRDDRGVVADGAAKSISVEHTFERDLLGREAVATELLRQAHRLAHRMHQAGRAGRTITIKIRFADFTTVTRSITAAAPVDAANRLYEAAIGMLDRLTLSAPVRLVGLGCSGLVPAAAPRQLSIDQPEKWQLAAGVIDEIERRFGAGAVQPARLVDPPD